MWRFLSSGMYRPYLSIGKNRSVSSTASLYIPRINFAEQTDEWDDVDRRSKLGRKFNQRYVRYAPYLCKLWHKACIANRTSLALVLLVHGLNCTKCTRALHIEKCFPSLAGLRKLIISKLVHLRSHIRSLRSARWARGRLTSPRN